MKLTENIGVISRFYQCLLAFVFILLLVGFLNIEITLSQEGRIENSQR